MENKRETYKDITLNDRRWRIGKFDARTGSYIIMKLVPFLLSAGLSNMAQISMEDIAMRIGALITRFSKAEFYELQNDCLSVVKEVTEVDGKEVALPLMLASGKWAVKDIEDDTLLILALTTQALVFNITGFFEGNALEKLGINFKTLNPDSSPLPTV